MKKFSSFFVVLLMLLAVIVSAQAATDGCNHMQRVWVVEREATCTTPGIRVYRCVDCREVLDRGTIPTIDHQPGSWHIVKNPTCREQGVRERYCIYCGVPYSTDEIDVVPHTFGSWIQTTAPTCQREGVETATCTVCGESRTRSAAKIDHIYGDWRVTRAATCAAEGEEARYCTMCGAATTRSTAKTDHVYGTWTLMLKATCTAEGQEQTSCTVCGSFKTRSIAPLGHSYGEYTVTKRGTCIEEGREESVCSVCGNIRSRTLPKTGHDYGPYLETRAPTCKAKGKAVATCSVCKETKSHAVPRIGHIFGDWEVTTEATDHTQGKKTSRCTMCGRAKTESFYPEGTLYKGCDAPAEEIEELQLVLGEMGLFKLPATGKYDSSTVAAVKKFQKKAGLKQDGIAWPQTRKRLGMFTAPGEAITDDIADYKLQLIVTQVSPIKAAYYDGDTVTYSWTLRNVSTKYDAKDTVLYTFAGMTPSAKTDTVIAQPETLIKGEEMSGTFDYVVTKQDVMAGGWTIGFIARCKYSKAYASNSVCFKNNAMLFDGMGGIGGDATLPEGGGKALMVSKTVANLPANGVHFVKGEEISFRIEITNTTVNDVAGVMATDAMFPDMKGEIGTLSAGKTVAFTGTYKVRAADVFRGEVKNTAVVSWMNADGTLGEAQATAIAFTGNAVNGPVIQKRLTNAPANGLYFVPGEEVRFEIEVINPTLETFTYLHLYDLLASEDDIMTSVKSLAPGEKLVYPFSWVVTDLQAAKGVLENVAKLTYQDPGMEKRTSVSNMCTVPTGFVGQNGIKIIKSIINPPENGRYYVDGEEIRYEITVVNNTLQDIGWFDLRDSLAMFDANGYRTIVSGGTLPAMETYTTHFSFPVGPHNVEATKVLNQASFVWNPTGYFDVEIFSNIVVAPTSEVSAPRIPGAPRIEGTACETVLTGLGEGIATHQLSECGTHSATAAMTGAMAGSGSYDAAEQLWDSDIAALYSEWLMETDSIGAQVVENDQAAFERQLKAWRSAMGLVADDQTVNTLVYEELMNKTVGLCYELHAAPADRPDSVAAVHDRVNAGDATVVCSHTVAYGDGSAQVVDCQCETHKQTAQMNDYLLSIANDDEERCAAWQRIQTNWLLELNTMYDTWYRAADSSTRRTVAADRMTFDEALRARQEALAELYPDDPTTAAEVLANMIMIRTQTVCRILHEAGILTTK